MHQYKISIIVPIYNTANYLRKCVNTLINQSYKNLEILLVDDGSTDNSGKLCDQYAQQDKRIQVIHKANGGLISAWKHGVEVSSGEYLCFVDSDDWIDLNMIEEMAEQLTGGRKEIIAADYVIERENGEKQFIRQKLPAGEYQGTQLKEKVMPLLLGYEERYVCISRCMKLISRRLIEENRKYSNPKVVMGEDMTIMLPALIDCERLVIMDKKPYYHYRHAATSMAHKYDKNLYENIRLLRKIILQVIEDKFTREQYQAMKTGADREYLFLILLVLKNEARGNRTGYYGNIREICKGSEIKELVKQTKVTINQAANKLLYYVLCHPNRLSISTLGMAMIWYDRKK